MSLPKTVYDEWFITMYNTVYTALPVLGLSLFDQVFLEHFCVVFFNPLPTFFQPFHPNFLNLTLLISKDVNDRWSFQYPQLYGPGQHNVLFNKKVFLRCVLHSCYSSLVVFFIPWAAMQDTVRDDGKDIADYQSFAVLAQTCLLVVVSVQVRTDSEEKEASDRSQALYNHNYKKENLGNFKNTILKFILKQSYNYNKKLPNVIIFCFASLPLQV